MKPTPWIIVNATAAHFGLLRSDIAGRATRTKRISNARSIACYLCREMTEFALTEIGASLGIDHTTVMYHHARVRERIADPVLLADLAAIRGAAEASAAKFNVPGCEGDTLATAKQRLSALLEVATRATHLAEELEDAIHRAEAAKAAHDEAEAALAGQRSGKLRHLQNLRRAKYPVQAGERD